MTETQQPDPMTQQMDQFEDEIELMDYLKVLWKWKYLIVVGTLVCAIGAGVVSLSMTKIWAVNTILQPGILKVTEEGKTIYIDSAQSIKALIETKAFNGLVTKGIKVSGQEKALKTADFKVTIPKGSNALDVLYETPNVNIGIQIVNNLNKAILARYERLIKQYKQTYLMGIRSKKAELSRMAEKVNEKRNAIYTVEAGYKAAVEQNANDISAENVQIETTKDQIKNLEQKLADVGSEIG
jgi:capsular polysaccharide biosynthesis protein